MAQQCFTSGRSTGRPRAATSDFRGPLVDDDADRHAVDLSARDPEIRHPPARREAARVAGAHTRRGLAAHARQLFRIDLLGADADPAQGAIAEAGELDRGDPRAALEEDL